MTNPHTGHPSSNATRKPLSWLREKTGGRNGARFYAVAITLYNVPIFWVIQIWYYNPFRSPQIFPELFIAPVVVSLLLGSAVLLVLGRRIGWIVSAPIISTMNMIIVGGTISKPYYSLTHGLDFLLILCPLLTIVQAFRPSVLAALSLRYSVAVPLYFVPWLLLLLLIILPR